MIPSSQPVNTSSPGFLFGNIIALSLTTVNPEKQKTRSEKGSVPQVSSLLRKDKLMLSARTIHHIVDYIAECCICLLLADYKRFVLFSRLKIVWHLKNIFGPGKKLITAARSWREYLARISAPDTMFDDQYYSKISDGEPLLRWAIRTPFLDGEEKRWYDYDISNFAKCKFSEMQGSEKPENRHFRSSPHYLVAKPDNRSSIL